MTTPSILIVDDDENNLELLGAVFQGYRVVKASDGLQALDVARREHPDLVVTDILMPSMDGYQLCREIKSDADLRETAVVFYTATYTDAEDRKLALGLGASRFLVKPASPAQLQAVVGEVLAERSEKHADADLEIADEPTYLRRYNRRLVAKLEQKLTQLDEANQKLRQEIAEREQAEARIRHLAYHDPLTDLPNRANLLERMREAFDEAGTRGEGCTLLVVDVDRFRDINHTLGHRNGDRLLQLVHQRLASELEEGDVLARLGADEFAILRTRHEEVEESLDLARTLGQAFESAFELDGLQVHISVSVGISRFPEHGADPALLLRHAEVAMHGVKGYRGSISVYTSHADPYEPRRLELISGIRDAIRNDELFLHYQPKIDLAQRTTVGAEALVRWRHPEHGFLSPDAFIGLVEQTGQIRALTHWLLRAALRQYAKWSRGGLDLHLCMNLSPRNLADDELPDTVAALLEEIGLERPAFTLEITESAILQDPPRARSILEAIASQGPRFAIDDFGTGFSSLSNLKQLPVSELKIDKSFVGGLTEDENDAIIVTSTIDLAHNLGLEVTAEGVETEPVCRRLRELGCDMAQGYYLARPMGAEELQHWVESSPWPLAG